MPIHLTPEQTALTGRIIGAAMEVHNNLGPGLPERYYQRALGREFTIRKLDFESQLPVQLVYKELQIGMNYLDFVVENQVIVEIKSVRALENVHLFQVIKYFAVTDYSVAQLINFGPAKLQYKRLFPPEKLLDFREKKRHKG